MREYILEKMENSPRRFRLGGIEVEEVDPLPNGINLDHILKAVEKNFPSHYFKGVKGIKINHLKDFDEREVNALYRDGYLHITNQQDNHQDILDDIVHEFAHHLETIHLEKIYGDESIKKEFLKKRKQLEYEIRSEGYWTDEFDFSDVMFSTAFDNFLYKRVGKNMLKMVTSGLFIRPYAAVSLREYFATGFEAYYLGKQDSLKKISPFLYLKIDEIHKDLYNK